MTSFGQDVRFSLRMITKAPGYAALAILTLALGIGANTTIFSWINATLLNPIPGLDKPHEVVALSLSKPAENPFLFTWPDIVAMRDGQRSFTGIMASGMTAMSLTGKGKPQRVWGMVASANYFNVLGVRPVLGRGFLASEEAKPGAAPVAVISYRMWQMQFGADPAIVDRKIELNGHPYTIVGVAPEGFQGTQTGLRSDLWVPMMMVQQVSEQGDLIHDHHFFWLSAFGRLRAGVTPQQAQQDVTLRLQPEIRNYPDEHKGHETVTVYPLWRSPFSMNQILSVLLPMLMALAGFVLLLACVNVANLMLVRSVARRRELAIRMSLGASRWRLVRQLLIESLVLALAGGGVATVLTLWTSGSLMRFIPAGDFPVGLAIHVDRTVLLATLAISLITGVVFGILPAVRASAEGPAGVLKEDAGSISGGVHKARLTSGLVVAQISLSLLLLICAGLFIRSFVRAQLINPGFNPHNVVIASYDLFTAGYSPEAGAEFDRQLVTKLEALPGVQSVALSSVVPVGFPTGSTSVKPEGYVPQAHESMEINDNTVTPGYFRTMQIPIVEGRDFTLRDRMSAMRAVIVSRAFAERYWPRQEAIGKRLFTDRTHEWFTVTGVAENTKATGLKKPRPFLYLPLYQVYRASMVVNARVAGDPLESGTAIVQAVHELNPELVAYDVADLNSRWQLASFQQRIAGTFVGAFGLVALILATVGIYGVTAYTTRQRVREIGIRMALGATKEDVMRIVLARGLGLTLIGVALGLAASFGLTRFLEESLLLGVTSTDALTFVSVVLLLCAVTLVACFIPARRAVRVDPMVALRHE
jgi:predicted permease